MSKPIHYLQLRLAPRIAEELKAEASRLRTSQNRLVTRYITEKLGVPDEDTIREGEDSA